MTSAPSWTGKCWSLAQQSPDICPRRWTSCKPNFGDVATFLAWTRQQPWMVLHELAHAYHFRVFGYDDKELKRRWEAARDGGTHDQVLHIQGMTKKHYAMNNPMEYFAELSESYFGTNDSYPFVRGYELIRRMWDAGLQ